MNENNFLYRVAFGTLRLLIQNKAMHYTSGTVFYVWQRENRVIVSFDPSAIRLERVNDRFAHDLSTSLEGRRVIRTNTRGLFLQVGLETPAMSISLDKLLPLDLTQQPSPWHLPVGVTENGPLWIPLTGGISFLLGGSTGTGKTGEEHAWIQALLHGGRTLVYAWDGKHSIEFIRYADRPNFHLILKPGDFDGLQAMFKEREQQLVRSGCVNIWDHNEEHPDDFIMPVALFVDEAADVPDSVKTLLKEMGRIYRYVGLYPIIATNQPTQAEMFPKGNLRTRVSFRVPHHTESVTMLGFKGAESLPDVLGRGLINWKSKLIEFQSFLVTYPDVTDAQRLLVSGQTAEAESVPAASNTDVDPKAELKKKIIDLYLDYVNHNREPVLAEIERQAYGQVRGGSYHNFIKKVIAKFEGAEENTTTTTEHPRVLGLEGS